MGENTKREGNKLHQKRGEKAFKNLKIKNLLAGYKLCTFSMGKFLFRSGKSQICNAIGKDNRNYFTDPDH